MGFPITGGRGRPNAAPPLCSSPPSLNHIPVDRIGRTNICEGTVSKRRNLCHPHPHPEEIGFRPCPATSQWGSSPSPGFACVRVVKSGPERGYQHLPPVRPKAHQYRPPLNLPHYCHHRPRHHNHRSHHHRCCLRNYRHHFYRHYRRRFHRHYRHSSHHHPRPEPQG